GDVTPWNLLKTSEGWVLLDWEDARHSAPPFYDVFHHLVQSHVLLGTPSLGSLVRPWTGPGWMQTAIRAYSDGASIPLSAWRSHLVEYLRTSQESLDPSQSGHARALRDRQSILRSLT
ncbi:MAG TPA: hypothetical protein VID47_16995, partial [Actinomycetota bacterium]